ncbi:hypothetical protein, partial [Klebsiella pneumoniae]
MESNINSRKHINQTSPMQHVIAYIKDNFKVKSEENYDDGTETKMIAFEDDELIFIVDIYPTKPNHLRVYILFDEHFNMELLNKANSMSRFAKGSFIEQQQGTRLCVEIEQMMYGLQTRSSSEKYIKLATQYLVKF